MRDAVIYKGSYAARSMHACDTTKSEWEGEKETQAVACASMWCNRMLVNGSTANFEQNHSITPMKVRNPYFTIVK